MCQSNDFLLDKLTLCIPSQPLSVSDQRVFEPHDRLRVVEIGAMDQIDCVVNAGEVRV
jgi:hypothetical protein